MDFKKMYGEKLKTPEEIAETFSPGYKVMSDIALASPHVNQTTLGNNNGIPQTISLGCGFWSGNSISENIEWYHFYQTTRVSSVIPNRRTYQEGDFDRYDVCPIQTEEV